MMAKPAYLSVEIVTDNRTSAKISIPQVVSVAEQTGLSNTWSQPQYLSQHACVSTLHANWCYMYLQTFILTSFKNIFHVSDRVRDHVYLIISGSLKPYQNFGPDLSPACLLMFSVVIRDQRDRQFQNRPRVFYQVARVVSVALTRENIHYIWKIVKLQIHNRPCGGLQECHF